MKRLTFGFLVALLVVFTGCSQKDVEVTEETKTEQTNKSAETNTQEPVGCRHENSRRHDRHA